MHVLLVGMATDPDNVSVDIAVMQPHRYIYHRFSYPNTAHVILLVIDHGMAPP